jgi:hypothetical protein
MAGRSLKSTLSSGLMRDASTGGGPAVPNTNMAAMPRTTRAAKLAIRSIFIAGMLTFCGQRLPHGARQASANLAVSFESTSPKQ